MRLLFTAIVFSAACSAHAEELVLLGRLKAIEKEVASCGVLYFGSVAEYEVLRVVSGTYARNRIFVVHGCAEMPRSMMLGDAGSLTSFVVGDVHNLVLVSDNVHRIELFNANKIPSPFATYFCKKVDPFDLPRHKSHNRTPQRTAGAAAERER